MSPLFFGISSPRLILAYPSGWGLPIAPGIAPKIPNPVTASAPNSVAFYAARNFWLYPLMTHSEVGLLLRIRPRRHMDMHQKNRMEIPNENQKTNIQPALRAGPKSHR